VRLDAGKLPDAWVLENYRATSSKPRGRSPPDAAAMLNLSEDHLDRYSGLAAYGRAKAARPSRGDGAQVLNRDDPGFDFDGCERPASGSRSAWAGPPEEIDFGCIALDGKKWIAPRAQRTGCGRCAADPRPAQRGPIAMAALAMARANLRALHAPGRVGS